MDGLGRGACEFLDAADDVSGTPAELVGTPLEVALTAAKHPLGGLTTLAELTLGLRARAPDLALELVALGRATALELAKVDRQVAPKPASSRSAPARDVYGRTASITLSRAVSAAPT